MNTVGIGVPPETAKVGDTISVHRVHFPHAKRTITGNVRAEIVALKQTSLGINAKVRVGGKYSTVYNVEMEAAGPVT